MVEKSLGQQVKILRTDNGGEYTSNEFETYLKKEGIRHELTILSIRQKKRQVKNFRFSFYCIARLYGMKCTISATISVLLQLFYVLLKKKENANSQQTYFIHYKKRQVEFLEWKNANCPVKCYKKRQFDMALFFTYKFLGIDGSKYQLAFFHSQ